MWQCLSRSPYVDNSVLQHSVTWLCKSHPTVLSAIIHGAIQQGGTCAGHATFAMIEGVRLGGGTHSKWALYGDGDEPDTSDKRVREAASTG